MSANTPGECSAVQCSACSMWARPITLKRLPCSQNERFPPSSCPPSLVGGSDWSRDARRVTRFARFPVCWCDPVLWMMTQSVYQWSLLTEAASGQPLNVGCSTSTYVSHVSPFICLTQQGDSKPFSFLCVYVAACAGHKRSKESGCPETDRCELACTPNFCCRVVCVPDYMLQSVHHSNLIDLIDQLLVHHLDPSLPWCDVVQDHLHST